jgi:CRP-like cAMP-binding protein
MSESLTKPTLPTFSWIGHLKEDDRDLLSSYGEFFPGHPGNVIIEEGVPQTEVFVVITGELEVHGAGADGVPILRARVGPGETLGEISLFDPGPATATVRATEFSQLWRIADSDLIQFMEDNPGAGLVLLRTLATILAQRLRRVDPEAFGLSAYAVVESPELEEQDAADLEEEEAAAAAVAPVVPASSPVVPLPVPEATPPPVVPITKSGTEAAPSSTPLTPVKSAPAGAGTLGKQPPAATLHSTAPARGKMPAETQIIPDPDEIEPL